MRKRSFSAALAALTTTGALVLTGLAPAAAADLPQPSEHAFACAQQGPVTFGGAPSERFNILDPGDACAPTNDYLLGVDEFVTNQAFADYLHRHGFDRNFLLWAPQVTTSNAELKNTVWSYCLDGHDSGTVCAGGAGHQYSPAQLFNGPMTVKLGMDGSFIGLLCGNFTQHGGRGPVPEIRGTKYEDMNGNGQRDAGEPGVAGFEIVLHLNGHEVARTTTGADGRYAFALNAEANRQLGAGTYTLTEVQKDGWVASAAPGPVSIGYGQGATVRQDSLGAAPVVESKVFDGNDFGNFRPATIEGRKFRDLNVDGSGTGEPGVAGWGISLTGDATRSLTTGPDGSYSFAGLRPGTYTVSEEQRAGWRQSAPVSGTITRTVRSGDTIRGAEFGNVCLGDATVTVRDQADGSTVPGLETRLEEVDVPGILDNDPALPLTRTDGAFTDLLPGTYRVTTFLPDGVFSSDPDTTLVDGRWATVKTVTVTECGNTELTIDVFRSSRGKVTGGMKQEIDGGFATAGFQFQTHRGEPRGSLQFNDHTADGPKLHTHQIEGIWVSDDRTEAWVWGRVDHDGRSERFRLHLVDLGEPGRQDRFELMLNGFSSGLGVTLIGGNVQIHKN